MNDLMHSEVFLVSLTFVAYIVAQRIYQKLNIIFLNPVLIAIVVVILYLHFMGIEYQDYADNTKVISFWLNPSVVALAIPLYLQMKRIKKDGVRILLATLSGSVVGIVSVVVIAKLLGASQEIIFSLAPKSVSTPIALNISEAIGGLPPLTTAIVVVVGVFGAVLGESILKLSRITDPNAVGLAMGTASHALGTAKIATKGDEYGSYSAMGLAINGILTSLLIPEILPLLERWMN
ncbi:MAG: LrgB family protein [Bacteroidales bacterium]|jgi:predicted murein hydrolase (TIGR00659 family)|nr:LrgB family protein [Bacteroidales bacterium]